ncbi:MAG: Crp/Fnr family transcriptional regulator [Actinobacteria bacterium]|nr:Crp/Fnr family transcriptional regulator [Actinomycetota bacterium]
MVESTILASTELFEPFTPEELDALTTSATTHALSRNDVLFSEGDEPDNVYVAVSGRIAIVNRSIDGRESVIALMEAGDLFGEMGLFDSEGRSAGARALEPSEVVEIPYAPIRKIYTDRPQLLWEVVRLLARRIRVTDTALADSVFLDVTGRTAKRLLELAGDAEEFALPVTQEELAGMVGASRERVNKAIASFVRLGWIDQSDRRYRIVHREELERRSS